MKIAMIGQKGLPAVWGGVERSVEEISVRLVKEGHEVTVYCRRWYSNWKHPRYQGVALRFVPSLRTKNLDTISHAFLATIDALVRDFDVIHYHGVGPALLCWLPRLLKPRVKVVVTFQCLDRFHIKWGAFARLMLRLGEWAACKFPHRTIVVSKNLQDYIKKNYQTNAAYIPNGVDISENHESAGSESLEKFGLETKKYLLVVSRLIPHKAIHYLIEAFRRVKKEQPDLAKDLKLAIVGDGYFTDDYVKYLHEMARGLKEVVFTGWQNGHALNELFSNALIFVHPSQSEGLPMAVLEAMGNGLPVIASDIPQHQEMIADKRFIFACNQISDLKDKIVWALSNPEILKVAGIQNRQIAEKGYHWDKIACQTLNLYQELITAISANQPVFRVKRLPVVN